MFVGRHIIFLKKKFIQEGGRGRSVELEKVQNLQSIQDLPNNFQPDVPIVEVQPLHTPPLQRSSKVCSVPSDMDLSLRMTIQPTSLRMMIPQPIQKLS